MSAPYLHQQVQLCSSSLIQGRHALTDQRAEALTQLQDLVQAVEHLRTGGLSRQHLQVSLSSSCLSESYRLQQDEGLGQQVAEEVIVGQPDALKVSGGVDLLEQLRKLRLQNVHLLDTRRTGQEKTWF